jgi:nucleoside-diphosphate-sugar epimerase
MAWTILRPCHIFGPGSLLGCSAPDNRDAKLIDKLRAGQTIPIVGPQLLQQPIFAPDLAELILSVRGNGYAGGRVFNAAGPDVIESWSYYQHVADALGVPLKVEEIPVQPYLQANPDKAPFLCHRFYDLTRLRDTGLAAPSTPIAEALRQHVRSLLAVG